MDSPLPQPLDFEEIVNTHYQAVYQFALRLCLKEDVAWDLAQQTFYKWATKGDQLRDRQRVKSWLFTTVHREFLSSRRRSVRFPHHDIEMVEAELPTLDPDVAASVDANIVVGALADIEPNLRAVLVLFYLEDFSYQEISAVLSIPMGTVQSRIYRAKAALFQILGGQPEVEGTR